MTKRFRRRVERGERGAALVEFALILPIFMTLVLGMFSGGQAYDRKLQMTHASREGARYGASLAEDEIFTAPSTWATTVRDVVVERSAGELTNDQVCVALVAGAGLGTATAADYAWKGSNSGGDLGALTGCYNDGTTDPSDKRVQILTRRSAEIDALFFTIPITLRSEAAAFHESED